MIAFILANWKSIATAATGAALGAILMLGWTMTVTVPNARQEGREAERAAMAVASQKAEMERKGDDQLLRSLSDYDLCVEHLRDRGMPTDACGQLRGLRQQ